MEERLPLITERALVRIQLGAQLLARASSNGKTPVFQTGDAVSIPAARTDTASRGQSARRGTPACQAGRAGATPAGRTRARSPMRYVDCKPTDEGLTPSELSDSPPVPFVSPRCPRGPTERAPGFEPGRCGWHAFGAHLGERASLVLSLGFNSLRGRPFAKTCLCSSTERAPDCEAGNAGSTPARGAARSLPVAQPERASVF